MQRLYEWISQRHKQNSAAMASSNAARLGQLTSRQRTIFWLVLALYAAVCIPIGWARGGDLRVEMGVAKHWLTGTPLYLANPDTGVHWPPFAIFAVVPFALLGRIATRLAQAAWTVSSAAALAWVVLACGRRWGWRTALLAVFAVGKPLQANFERLNLGVLLLALITAAAIDLEENHESRAAIWIGLASALKMFPALLILYLAMRRRWRAAGIAAAVAIACTVLPMLRYGPAGAFDTISHWLALSRASPQAGELRGQMLAGMATGLGGSFALAIALQIAVVAIVLMALSRPASDAPAGVGLVTQLAVLLSPIGHFHYEVLAIPAWIGALAHPRPPGRWWIPTLVGAAVFLSGVLTFDHVYPEALQPVKQYNYVWGAVLLVIALAARRLQHAPLRQGVAVE
jgi:hypothetical protein